MLTGERPFETFFSGYTPIFHLFLMPIYSLMGFSFQAILFNRFIMILVLMMRILVTFLLVKKIFGKSAYLFIIYFLLSIYTVFSGMQIRPDNLMYLVFILGLYTFSLGLTGFKKGYLFVSGIFLSLAILITIKIVPGVTVICLVFIMFGVVKKEWAGLSTFFMGILLPVIVFFSYYLLRGSLVEIYQMVFLDAAGIVNYYWSFAPLGAFLQPNNDLIFALSGRNPVWLFMWGSMLFSFSGWFLVLREVLKEGLKNSKMVLKLVLCLIYPAQWAMLFFANSVFIQYFLSVNWLEAIFLAVFTIEVLKLMGRVRYLQMGAGIIFIATLSYFIYFGVKANYNRSSMTWDDQTRGMEELWKKIPSHEPVFQNILFRPLGYPVPVGYNIELFPASRLSKLPSLEKELKKRKVNWLDLSARNIEVLSSVKPDWGWTIKNNYQLREGESELWERKTKSK